MSKEPVTAIQKTSPIYGLASKFNIDPNKLIEVLRGTVIKPSKGGHAATNEEVAAFCIVAQQYGLNPFTREIHAFTSGEKGVVPIVGIDGWTHIVNREGTFDGCEFDEVEGENGLPDRITCKMYVKDRQHPVCATERFKECKRNSIPWSTMPWRMLRHKAYMQAARYAFGLSGIYDEDEARDIINVTPLKEPIKQPKSVDDPPETQAEDTGTTEAAPEGPIETVDDIITAVHDKKGKMPYRIETKNAGVFKTENVAHFDEAQTIASSALQVTLHFVNKESGQWLVKMVQ